MDVQADPGREVLMRDGFRVGVVAGTKGGDEETGQA